jgi:hypothetical protein
MFYQYNKHREKNCEPGDTVISRGPLIRALQLQSYVSGVNSVADINMTGWDTVGTGPSIEIQSFALCFNNP